MNPTLGLIISSLTLLGIIGGGIITASKILAKIDTNDQTQALINENNEKQFEWLQNQVEYLTKEKEKSYREIMEKLDVIRNQINELRVENARRKND